MQTAERESPREPLRPAVDRINRVSAGEPCGSQLEEARQLRDMLLAQITVAGMINHCSVSMTLDDAVALERLLSDSIDQAERMGVT